MKRAGAFDVVVVGAGYGGITAAALLARAGRKVLVLEQNRLVGGKAMTVRGRTGRHELWPVSGGPAGCSRFHELIELLGLESECRILTPERAAEFLYLPRSGKPRSMVVPARAVRSPLRIARHLREIGISLWDTPRVLAMALAVRALSERDLDSLDDVSILEWMRRFRLPRSFESYFLTLMNLLFVVPVDRLPASEALRTLRDVDRGGAGRYHAGGFGHVAEEAADYVTRHGGTVVTRARVERIIARAGRVEGVVTGDGRYRAPVVLSSAGIQPTVLRLVGEHHFDAGYVTRIRSLEPSWAIVGVRYHLDAPVLRTPMTVAYSDESWWDSARFARACAAGAAGMPMVFAVVPSLYDPSVAPAPGRQTVLLGTLGSPDPRSPVNAGLVARLEAEADRLWPSLRAHVVARQTYGPRQVSRLTRDAVVPGQGGECIGIGQLVGQCGRSKPDARSPIRGLYYVGCDAGGSGCGTHQAVDSGFRVAAMVLADARAWGVETGSASRRVNRRRLPAQRGKPGRAAQASRPRAVER